jgi:hypothetical protein
LLVRWFDAWAWSLSTAQDAQLLTPEVVGTVGKVTRF